jgi:hypothetical protein
MQRILKGPAVVIWVTWLQIILGPADDFCENCDDFFPTVTAKLDGMTPVGFKEQLACHQVHFVIHAEDIEGSCSSHLGNMAANHLGSS